ncbi:nucleotide pyrophosphatase, partial [Vibrio anguillarum]|nr:nucleotide pyrophosphatase [Vibrio anguillarum]
HFVDRPTDRAYYFFGNDALQLDRLLVKNQVQTMFDRLAYLNTLNCNAQYDWNAHTTYDGLVNLGAGEALRDFGEKRCVRELKERAIVERELQQLRATLVEEVT